MGRPKKNPEGHEQHNIVQMGGNISGLLEEIKRERDKVIALKKKRSEINAQIAESRARMEAKGITKWAFDSALAYFEADVDKRQGFDEAYAIAREGMGLAFKQGDLFEGDQPRDSGVDGNSGTHGASDDDDEGDVDGATAHG